MVYEGFWDLYCKKPQTSELTSRKLDGWINKINLKVPTFKQPQPPEEPPAEQEKPAEGEPNAAGSEKKEGEGEQQPAAEVEEKPLPPDHDLPDPPPLRAIVRIRIPLVREEPPEEGAEE